MSVVSRPIAVRFQQPRTAGAQGTIAVEFYGTDGQPVCRVYYRTLLHPPVKQLAISPADHYIETDTQFSLCIELLVQIDILLTDTCVVKTGNSIFVAGSERDVQ